MRRKYGLNINIPGINITDSVTDKDLYVEREQDTVARTDIEVSPGW